VSLFSPAQNKVWFQLRVSGLFPSAYWFGQALVDIPLYCFVFLFMSLMDYLLGFPDATLIVITHVLQVSAKRLGNANLFHGQRCARH